MTRFAVDILMFSCLVAAMFCLGGLAGYGAWLLVTALLRGVAA